MDAAVLAHIGAPLVEAAGAGAGVCVATDAESAAATPAAATPATATPAEATPAADKALTQVVATASLQPAPH